MDGILASFAQGQCASPGLQYSTYPYQVPDGHGGLHAYYGAHQQYVPAGWFGNVPGQFAQPIGASFGGLFGNPQLGGVLGGQYANLNPFGGGIQIPQLIQPIGGIPQFGSIPGGIGSQLWGSIPFSVAQPATQQVAQQAAQAAQQAGQQVAQQAAQHAAHQVACQAAQAAQQAASQAAQAAQQVGQQGAQQVALQGAQQIGVQPAQQAALQAAQAAQQVAQQAAHQAALQAAQQVGQVAAQAAQQAGYQVAQQVAAGCTGQQWYSPLNALGAQYIAPQPWASQGGYGNPWGQTYQPFGMIGGGLPQYTGVFGGFGGQLPWSTNPLAAWSQSGLQGAYGGMAGSALGGFGRAINPLNPYAGASLGNQTQFAPAPRFSFA